MSLTDEWKAERLRKEKDYFVKTSCNGKIYPAHLYDDNSFSFCGNRTEYFPVEGTDIEVLAPCDYEERADHIDTMAKQGAEIERLKAENKQMFDLLEMVARGITLWADTEDVIKITSAVKTFCIAKRESEEK